MAVKLGYRQTELGVIPEEWDVKPLKGLVSISHGFAFTSEYFANYGPFRLTTPGHFFEGGGFRDIGEKQKFYVGPVPCDYVLSGGDMVIAMTEQADGLLGSAALIPDDEGYLHNQRLGRVRALSLEVELDYLFYVFNSSSYRDKVRETAAGTKVKHTSPEKLLEISVRLPGPSEQRAIATALRDVDALLGALERLITKKRDLKQAAMQQLLTGQTRLPGFHGEWVVERLAHAGRCLRGVSYRGDGDLSTHDTAYTKRLLRSNNVQDALVTTSEVQFVNSARVSSSQVLKNGDILICMANGSKALVGKAGLFSINDGYDYTFGAFMGCFRTDATTADPAFVFSLMQTGRYRDYINNLLAGSSINNLRPSSIESLEFSFPPISEQAAIASLLNDMDAELAALALRLAKTRTLKQGMMQELLTGRTRLL